MRRALYILGELRDEDIVWLASVGERRSVAQGQTVIHAGAPIDTLFLVIDGRLAVTVSNGQSIAELGPGDIVGEMSLVEERPPAVSVTTVTGCLLLAVSHADLRDELARNQGLAARFYRALAVFLSDRLRGTVSRLGYGQQGSSDAGGEMPDENELDDVLLDRLHLAGDRLRRLVDMVQR